MALLAGAVLNAGCEARSSVEAAQTAVVAAQTVLPAAQATAQTGATMVSGILADVQSITTQLQPILGGLQIDLATTPPGAANDAVTGVQLRAIDSGGRFAQLDANGRQAAATGALLLVGQYYPQASVTLTVQDPSGATLIAGTRAPGAAPRIQ
jgi:hypothetical protein